jgi:hypothetical protein
VTAPSTGSTGGDAEGRPAPVTVNVGAAGGVSVAHLVELAYRYGIAVVFACVLLGALLYYANRLDDRSRDNAHQVAVIQQQLALAERRDERQLLLLDQLNAAVSRLEAAGTGRQP